MTRRWGCIVLLVALVALVLFCGWVWQNNIRLPIF